jgi:SAM-dependent methyltransferase
VDQEIILQTFQHPTGNTPKSVALVCLGPSHRAYIGANFEPDLSEVVTGVDEIWTLNRGIGVFRHDLAFVMDHIQGEADKHPRYGAMLWKHNKPIITSDNYPNWPNHVRQFPFKEIWNWTIGAVNPMHGDWYHNSVAYIVVYAGFIGVKELRVFGADYSLHSSGVVEDGHPNVAYWVGKMEAVGLKVVAPADSSFLNVNQRSWIYGYQNDPRTIPANRARFRAMVGEPADPDSTALLSGERQVASDLEYIQPDHRARYAWAAGKVGWNDGLLDIGCGVGYGTAMLADRVGTNGRVVGYERSVESLDFAKATYDRPNIEWTEFDLDGRTLPVAETTYDAATAFEIIEHLANPKPMLASIPAQRLFASVPNEAVIPYSPESAPFHQRHYTSEQFGELLKECGWHVVEWRGQAGPQAPVGPLETTSRTLVVEAVRCQK